MVSSMMFMVNVKMEEIRDMRLLSSMANARRFKPQAWPVTNPGPAMRRKHAHAKRMRARNVRDVLVTLTLTAGALTVLAWL
jgi:hypothetical protein